MTRARLIAAAAVLALCAETAGLVALGAFLGNSGPPVAETCQPQS